MWGRQKRAAVAAAVTPALLAADWRADAVAAALAAALERRPRWLRGVVRELLAAYRERPADRPREVAAYLEHLLAVRDEHGRLGRPPPLRLWSVFDPAMGAAPWPVPAVATFAELAAFLDVHVGELEWLADRRALERSVPAEQLRHYRYAWFPRRGAPPRLVERPKRLLKTTQRRVLHEILDRIPPHEAAQGFRPGHSVITHARRHVGRPSVLRLDLEDFFASVDAGRVYGIFRRAGYPETVAHALTALCTNVVPQAEREQLRAAESRLVPSYHRLERRLASPHLPQGAPTSPALANLVAFGLDRRLSALAVSIGATYSRYADDIALSGDWWLASRADSLVELVTAIAREERFRVSERKVALMTQAGRQRLCGVVVNRHPNVARREFDQLKAVIHDAVVNGPVAANRARVADFRAHLLGRISWVESLNPARGRRLRKRFAEIDWGRTQPESTPP